MNRFFIDQPLSLGGHIELPKAIAHHAFRVLRLRESDSILLWNGDGTAYEATLHGHEKQANALITTSTPTQVELKRAIWVAQALPEGDKMDWVIEKCTEAGVSGFFPVAAQRSVVKLNAERAAKRLIHWQAIATAACNQSGRCKLPDVQATLPIKEWLMSLDQAMPETPLKLWLNPSAHRSLPQLNWSGTGPIVLAIGPEGGWTDQETALAHDHGFVSVGLSPRVYRTETAALVACSQITALAQLEPNLL